MFTLTRTERPGDETEVLLMFISGSLAFIVITGTSIAPHEWETTNFASQVYHYTRWLPHRQAQPTLPLATTTPPHLVVSLQLPIPSRSRLSTPHTFPFRYFFTHSPEIPSLACYVC